MVRPNLAGTKRLAEDKRAGFAGPRYAGVSADWFGEVFEKFVSRLEMGDVNRIGVRQQPQSIGRRAAAKERVGMDWLRIKGGVPNILEFLKIQADTKAIAQILGPGPCGHGAFLAVTPARIVFDRGSQLFRG